MMQRACSLILLMVFLVTGPVHAAGSKRPSNSFNFLRLKSSTGVRAPLVIEPGVLTPSSEDGAIEFDGNDLYITKSGVKTVLGSGGAKGDKGDKGDQGERGPRGFAGVSGPSGPAGPTGSFSGGDAVVSGILSFSTGRLQNAVLNGTSLFRNNSIAKFNGSILIPASAANGKVLTSNGGGLASWKTIGSVINGANLNLGTTLSGVTGAVQFSNGVNLASDASSLFWDNTNKRLGIGTNSPVRAKTKIVIGSAAEQGLVLQAAASQTGNLTEWRNSAGTQLTSINKDGDITIIKPGGVLYPTWLDFGHNNAASTFTLAHVAEGTQFTGLYGDFIFKNGAAGTATEKARLASSGNFGVGYVSPAARLSVNGSTFTKGFTLNGNTFVASTLAQGSLLVAKASGAIQELVKGTDHYALKVNGNKLAWEPVSGGTSAGGSSGQIQYNNAGAFGGTAAGTYATSGNLFTYTAQAATDKPLILKGATSQSANLTEWQNSAGTALASVSSAGKVAIGTTPALPMLLVQNSIGNYNNGQNIFQLNDNAGSVKLYTNWSGNTVGNFLSNAYGSGFALWDGVGGMSGVASTHADGTRYNNSISAYDNIVLSHSGGAGRAVFIGAASATPAAGRIYGAQGLGTNIAGATLSIAGGAATGNATGGSLLFQTSDAGASSTTLQTLTTKMRIAPSGNVLVNGFSLSTVGLTIKAAASQTANLTEWQNSAGTVLASVSNGGTPTFGRINLGANNISFREPYGGQLGIYVSNALSLLTDSNNFSFKNSANIRWSSSSAADDTPDTGVSRNAAGILEVNSGTAGQYRDLKVRKVSMTSAMRLEPLSGSQPSSPSMGDMYMDGDTGTLCLYEGTMWTPVAGRDYNCN